MAGQRATTLFPEMVDFADTTAGSPVSAPLADRMRPRSLRGFVGQEHLMGEGRVLRRLIEGGGTLPSMIFWGPRLPKRASTDDEAAARFYSSMKFIASTKPSRMRSCRQSRMEPSR